MAKAEFLQQAHWLKPNKHALSRAFMSEKKDGIRCFWDGGFTRGIPASDVPFANTEKDARFRKPPVATGLWTRYGNIIHAPDWWLDQLPPIMLDGELYAGIKSRQALTSARKLIPEDWAWRKITFEVFDAPGFDAVFQPRHINLIHYNKEIDYDAIKEMAKDKIELRDNKPYSITLKVLEKKVPENDVIKILPQELLPAVSSDAESRVMEYLDEILDMGGEGVVVRLHNAYWEPHRSHSLLKLKGSRDAEATVIGYRSGRETDKGSKLLGLMGSLRLKYEDVEFEISGFTDQERILSPQPDAYEYAKRNPGEELPDWIYSKNFPRGSLVKFRYRELSDDGVPIEARYCRS